MKEKWLPVYGWTGFYEVSDRGRVRSLSRTIILKDGRKRPMKGRVLKHGSNPDGYPLVVLARNGEKHTKMVHVLVAMAFRGKRPSGFHTRHKDGRAQNCRAGNLHYGTPSQNSRDRVDHGTVNRGERNGSSSLTRRQILTIRRRYAAGGVLQREIAAQYGIAPNTVSRIVNGRRWGWL